MAGSHIVEPEYVFCRPNLAFKYIKHVVDLASDPIEVDGIYKFMDNYDEWDNLPNIAIAGNDTGSSHTFIAVITNGPANKSIKSDFGIGKCHS